MEKNLNLTEQFVLLAVNSKKVHYKSTYVASCGLLQLIYDKKLVINDKKKVVVADSSLTGYEYLDEIIKLVQSKKAKTIKRWVDFFYCKSKISSNIYNSILNSLASNNLIELDEHKVLFISKKIINVKYDVDMLIEPIKTQIINNSITEENTLLLAFMLEISKLNKAYFTSDEQKELKFRLKELHKNDIWKNVKTIQNVITEYNFLPIYVSI